MSAIITSECGVNITDGSIVVRDDMPTAKWIAHFGWFTHEGEHTKGWYLASIPDNTIIPLTENELRHLSVLHNGELVHFAVKTRHDAFSGATWLDGIISGEMYELVTTLDEHCTDKQIPTAQATHQAIVAAKPRWTVIDDPETTEG